MHFYSVIPVRMEIITYKQMMNNLFLVAQTVFDIWIDIKMLNQNFK